MVSLSAASDTSLLAQLNRQKLGSGKYSDFKIECGSRVFSVHKCIITAQSEFLDAMCGNENFKESSESRGRLPEADPAIFEKVLQYLYIGDYQYDTEVCPCTCVLKTTAAKNNSNHKDEVADAQTAMEVLSLDAPDALMVHVQVYLLAGFLQIAPLEVLALNKANAMMECSFDVEKFSRGIEVAMIETIKDDLALRADVVRHCMLNIGQMSNHHALSLVLRAQEPVAWHLLTMFQKLHEDEMMVTVSDCNAFSAEIKSLKKRLYSETESLESQLKDAQTRVSKLEGDVLTAKERYETQEKLLLDYNECRNCNRPFWPYLEAAFQPGRGVAPLIRCNGCQCRHYPKK